MEQITVRELINKLLDYEMHLTVTFGGYPGFYIVEREAIGEISIVPTNRSNIFNGYLLEEE